MILLVTSSSRAKEYAAAMERGTGHQTQVASTVAQALSKIQVADYELLVIDQALLEADGRALDTLLNRCGTAMPVYVTLALHSSERVAREMQVALRRSQEEKRVAERTAGKLLRNQLRSEVTGILLNSELALRQSGLAPEIAEKILSMRELAEKMRSQLEIR
jgi:DNA-binding NtrC family response regulator